MHFIYLFKRIKIENLDKLESDLNCLNEEISELRKQLIRAEDLSLYKISLIKNKMCLLFLKFPSIILSFGIYNQDYKSFSKKVFSITLMLILSSFVLPFIPFCNFLYLILSILHLILQLYNVNVFAKLHSVNKKMQDDAVAFGKDFAELERLVNFTLNKKEKDLDKQDEKTKTYRLAEGMIEYYMREGIILQLPEEVNAIVIQILQKELNTDENNLEALLINAKKNVSTEINANAMVRIRKRTKNN